MEALLKPAVAPELLAQMQDLSGLQFFTQLLVKDQRWREYARSWLRNLEPLSVVRHSAVRHCDDQGAHSGRLRGLQGHPRGRLPRRAAGAGHRRLQRLDGGS